MFRFCWNSSDRGSPVLRLDSFFITPLKSPWLVQPSSLLVSLFHGRRNGGDRRLSPSSVCRSPSVNSESPDFGHDVANKALWIDGSAIPSGVKAALKLATQTKLPSHESVQQRRFPKGDFGRGNTLPTSARESNRSAQVDGGVTHMRSAKTSIEAIAVLQNRLQRGIAVDSYVYVEVLKRCWKQEDLPAVKQVHKCVIESGMQQNTHVANNLLNAYIRCGRLEDACRVFDELAEKDLFSWTMMIGGYAQHSCAKDAMQVLDQMLQRGVRPDAVTYLTVLKACASPSALKWGEQVHSCIRDGDFESDVRVGTALLQMYAQCGSIKAARETFDKLASRNIISWTVMIGAYAESGRGEEAFGLFLQMKREGLQPNAITCLSILNAAASAGALDWVREVHSHAREAGFEFDVSVGNALVHMYAKCGSLDDARLHFDRMQARDVITWNAMIAGLAQRGSGREAFELFLQMKREGVQPTAITYVNILNACSSAGALQWVREVHRHAREAGFEFNLRVGNALVHMYAKCGSIDDARLVFDRMEERDVVCWNVMIGGLAQHGCGSEALEVFGNMVAAGVKPDGVSFVALLSACSHAGLVDEGRLVFRTMSQDYGIVASVVHWTCMVDMIARAGHLEEAKLLIKSMPVEPVAATWGALLAACRSYGNVELGELAANEIFKLNPLDPCTYVLLSNIYAAGENWEKVAWVRTLMLGRGIRKDPGRSWIEVGDKIHAFFVGDTYHPETKEIYAELSRLTAKIKAEGYLPDTRLVLLDVDEKEKEFSLCSHSEKLAIAYGLLHTHQGVNLFVFTRIFGPVRIVTQPPN